MESDIIKNEGFILVESLVSLFIVSIIISTISYGIYNVHTLVSKNEEKIKMIQLAESKIESMKNDTSNIDYDKVYKVGDYSINEVVKNEKFHKNLYIKVKSSSNLISLSSHVITK